VPTTFRQSLVPRTLYIRDEQPAAAPNYDLSRRVGLFLANANVPGLRRTRVDVDGDTVILFGRVRTFYERQIAVECSRRVAGVIQIEDQIEVDDDDSSCDS
jgi:hypothetical protein